MNWGGTRRTFFLKHVDEDALGAAGSHGLCQSFGALASEMENRQKDIDRIVEDQGRLRENMKALRGSAEEKALLHATG